PVGRVVDRRAVEAERGERTAVRGGDAESVASAAPGQQGTGYRLEGGLEHHTVVGDAAPHDECRLRRGPDGGLRFAEIEHGFIRVVAGPRRIAVAHQVVALLRRV